MIVRKLGKDAGIPKTVGPHKLRHAAITMALDTVSGDIRAVQKFSRLANLNTLLIYDDERKDLGGTVAAKMCAVMHGEATYGE